MQSKTGTWVRNNSILVALSSQCGNIHDAQAVEPAIHLHAHSTLVLRIYRDAAEMGSKYNTYVLWSHFVIARVESHKTVYLVARTILARVFPPQEKKMRFLYRSEVCVRCLNFSYISRLFT